MGVNLSRLTLSMATNAEIVERCDKLPAGPKERWDFEAGAALDFNLRYAVAKEAVFPSKRSAVAKASDIVAHALWPGIGVARLRRRRPISPAVAVATVGLAALLAVMHLKPIGFCFALGDGSCATLSGAAGLVVAPPDRRVHALRRVPSGPRAPPDHAARVQWFRLEYAVVHGAQLPCAGPLRRLAAAQSKGPTWPLKPGRDEVVRS